MTIKFEDFEKIDFRIGKIIEVLDYPEARNPSYKLQIDFGSELGIKKSVGQFPANYSKEELLGKLVSCVVNFEPRQIGKAISEVLITGYPDENGNAVLISPSKEVKLGSKLF